MSKKGENIYKRKDGRWEGRYICYYDENEKAKYGYVYARTYGEVKKRLVEKQNETAKSNTFLANRTVAYRDVLDAWLQSTRINTKESTYARYHHIVESHIKPVLGVYSLNKISTQLIEGYIDKLLKQGRLDKKGALSPKTVTDILTVLKSSIEYAKYNNQSVICNLGKLNVKKREKEIRVLSHAEQEALVRTLLHETDRFKFGVLLSMYTGVRIGELCALRCENINLDTATLRVRETLQRIQDTNNGATAKTKVVITEPKSKCSVRDIPLPECLIEIARQFIGTDRSYVLTGDKTKYVEPRTMQNHFKAYIEESGVKDANFHSLRHTFATRCVELGFEVKSLSEILGHANVNITLNRYVHSSFELKSSNMNKLELPA